MPVTALLSLDELLPLARQGDRAALETLFLASAPYLTLLARSRVEHGLHAEYDGTDLVQRTLLEAFRSFSCFHGATEGDWLGWLRRLLANTLTDRVRAGKRRPEVPVEFGSGTYPVAGVMLAVIPVRRGAELRLAAALERLPAEYRDVLLLRNLERLPFAEIAVRLSSSRAAVLELWLQALVALQEVLT